MSSFQGIDAATLIVAQATLSFITAPFKSPPYNFPLFLFGIYASERTESVESLRLFTGFLSVSVVWDIIFLAKEHQNGFIKLLNIINLIVKVPTALAALNSLRLRGDSFATSFTGGGQFGQMGGSQPVWSMPGAFSGRDGYQNVDDDLEGGANTPPAPHAPPKSVPVPVGHIVPAPGQQQQQPSAPGGYQTL